MATMKRVMCKQVSLTLAMVLAFLLCPPVGTAVADPPSGNKKLPNIVLVIMDDMGIDQWKSFGYGGATPAATPNIDAIGQGGVMFHNMWSMPACSNGRAAVFTGRYPFRTNVLTAIGNDDLANYMVNPNEMTLPRLLKQRGYKGALFGKFHLGVQSNDPFGYRMVPALGFDYFEGWLDATGDPSSIDITAGGVSPTGGWSCGFVRDAAHGGADSGACYAGDGACSVISKTGAEAPGRVCRDSGGIFVPDQTCNTPPPENIDFSTDSGHYVSPLVINHEDGTVEQVPPTDIRARTYRGIELVDAAIAWVEQQPPTQPWMAALTFATAHTPLMRPPSQTLPATEPDSSNLDCGSGSGDSTTGGRCDSNCSTSTIADLRAISNEMEESLDYEIGRFMTATGLATYGPDGGLIYDPKKTNTYVIFVADNGSLGTVVKPPFDPSRAKSTAYQTGVWVPAIVAGPGVVKAGRQTDAMVNIVDLYQLIAELAGIDVHQGVPRIVDSQSMLPYLKNPNQPSIRKTNFTQIGTNQHANGVINGPCVYNGTTCTQIAPSKGVCEDNNGVWWGQGNDLESEGVPEKGFPMCCDVAIWQHDHDYSPMVETIYPLEAYGVRNVHYKVVINQYQSYNAAADACEATTSNEFYEIDEKVKIPKLDTKGSNLLASGQPPLTPVQKENYEELISEFDRLLASQPACFGDINLDGAVNEADIDQWSMFQALSKGYSSWADLNKDGLTNPDDLDIIQQNLGPCPKTDGAGVGAPVGRLHNSSERGEIGKR